MTNNKKDNKLIWHIGMGVGVGLALIFAILFLIVGVIIYPTMPWPSPQPYANTQVQLSEGSIGSWGFARNQTYAVEQPLSEVRTYYEDEMRSFCIESVNVKTLSHGERYTPPNRWGLDELPQYVESSACLQLECDINRWSLAQEFEVLMCSENDTRTIVVQLDLWED